MASQALQRAGHDNTPEGEVGDGFLLTAATPIVQVGWEFDARVRARSASRCPAPPASPGWCARRSFPTARNASATVGDLVGYTPSDPASPQNTLRVRQRLGAGGRRSRARTWRCQGQHGHARGRVRAGTDLRARLHGNEPAGRGPRLRRRARRRVVGAVRRRRDGVGQVHAFAFGSSQTGRWLRDFVYEGSTPTSATAGSSTRVIPHIAGGGGVLLNRRWSTPTSLLMETATRFPFADRKQRDPGNRRRGRPAREPAGVRATSRRSSTRYSDTEYWERGGALAHTTPDGAKDVAPPANVRIYHFAGAPA